MSFLNQLASQINNQFSVGDNNGIENFTSKIDQSAVRSYTEEGFLRASPYNMTPKQFEVLFQEPSATILIKKRMFSSIAENFRPDFMDRDEKLYYKTIKILFQNKCTNIAALEKLSKIQKITSAVGSVSDQLLPIIITLSDAISANGNSEPDDLAKVLNKVRRLYGFNTENKITTWVTDSTNLFQSQFGQGTGVIEITNFTNLSTNTSVDGIKTSPPFNFSISDPYQSMLITEFDIEKAISDATNMFYNSEIFQFGKDSIDQIINNLQNKLNIIRNSRGASSISFKIDFEAFIGKRVFAILDRIGKELIFSYNIGIGAYVSPSYLEGGDILGNDGLSFAEFDLFKNLIESIYNKIQLNDNSKGAIQLNNKLTNYTRRKLTFNFLGKLVIQPMDVVHIYVGSKSTYDNKILTGLQNNFNGFGILQNLNNGIGNLTNAAGALFNPSNDINLQAEKSAFVGPDFPNYLWSILRNQFIDEKSGTHIFAGLVDVSSDNWSDGKYSVNISGRDNTAYFDQGKINFKPGADVFSGAIFDTLTPFKSNFDTINNNFGNGVQELLDENIAILGTSEDKKSLLKAKAGPDAGKKVYSDTFISGTLIDKNTGQKSKEIFAPDGLVYKWKEGIGVFVQFGNSLDLNDPNKVGSPNIANEPFAGQGVMDVLSLLITGQPYSYANYWKASQNIDGFNGDPQSNQDSAHSYIKSLRNDLVKNNTLWGNFIPFKNLVIDEQSFALAMQSQFRITQKSSDLDFKIQKLSDLNKQAAIFSASANGLFGQNFDSQFLGVKSQVNLLQESIQNDIDGIQKEDSNFNNLAIASGPDASFDSNDFIDSGKIGVSETDTNIRKTLRKKLNFLTKRMSYNIRANEDKNLFIVDDFYDKDFDIIAYEKSLTDGIKLYSNDFTSVREKIIATAHLLNLEVFSDTQGHIRVRPPQYNRMPSSIFYKMMNSKKETGIQIFPQFLSDFFGNQIDTLRKKIEVLEDLIRLDCAILNYMDDDKATQFILSNNVSSSSFNFISDSTGLISDINQLISLSNDEKTQDFISGLENQAKSTKSTFNNSQRYSEIIKQLMAQSLGLQGYSVHDVFTSSGTTYIQKLINRIQTKSGQRIDKKDYISNNNDGQKDVVLPLAETIDVFKVTKELQEKLQERQKVIKLFYSSIKNATEFKSLDNQSDTISNQMLAPSIFGNSNIPEVYEHMIEDESYDDYGVGSGSRFIIKNSQIRSLQITATPPEFTMVEVQGVLNVFAPDALPPGLNSFPDNGNGMVTAMAVDYDMWRNFGFKSSSTIKGVPFLSDPNSQLAPYASMILSNNRKNILRGTLTISGNEFMQPGEVIFLEDRQLLFYVTSVRHEFAFGSSFSTTLELTYGHAPGEYIPTILDVIGKMIYNNKDIAENTIQRQSNSGNENNLGAMMMNSGSASSGDSEELSNYDIFNNKIINNILYTAANTVNSNNTKGNNVIANVELRIYFDDQSSASSILNSFAEDIKKILTGTKNNEPTTNPTFLTDDVKIIKINLDDINDRRSPSQKAIDLARSLISLAKDVGNDKIRSSLFENVVDCWLTFTQMDFNNVK